LAAYFPKNDWLLLVDESHVAAPQIKVHSSFEGGSRALGSDAEGVSINSFNPLHI